MEWARRRVFPAAPSALPSAGPLLGQESGWPLTEHLLQSLASCSVFGKQYFFGPRGPPPPPQVSVWTSTTRQGNFPAGVRWPSGHTDLPPCVASVTSACPSRLDRPGTEGKGTFTGCSVRRPAFWQALSICRVNRGEVTCLHRCSGEAFPW